jgi:hypothetical protein
MDGPRLFSGSAQIGQSPRPNWLTVAEQLRAGGFEVIANGPEGMRKRIADEVPKWREVVAKAGIQPI